MVIDLQKVILNLKQNNNIAILAHKNPDGDTIGSSFALMYALSSMGKRSRVLCNDEYPKDLIFAVGVYSEEDFEPEYSEEDFEPEYVVSVDISDSQLLGSDIFNKYANKVDMAIDHHRTHKSFAKEEYIQPTAAATAEIIYEIILSLGVKITKEIANCIYLGISTDTGCFKYSNVTKHTFYVAGELVEAGADTAKINKRIFDTKSRKQVEVESIIANSIKYYFDDKCAVVQIPVDFLETHGATEDDMCNVTNIPRQIDGVEISVVIKEKEDGVCKASVRCDETINAALICQTFGGGGHYAAAGCVIPGNLDTAEKMLIDAIEKRLKEINVI